MNYCFFAASLPTVTMGKIPPLSVAEFDAMAAEELSAKDFAIMTSWDDPAAAKLPAVYREMRTFDNFLSWRIAVLRADRLGQTQDFEVPEEFIGEIDFAMPAAAASNIPAEREEAIDLLRWRKMDELELFHDFDVEHFCIYRLKLLAMEKLLLRAENNGEEIFSQMVDKIDPAEEKQ